MCEALVNAIPVLRFAHCEARNGVKKKSGRLRGNYFRNFTRNASAESLPVEHRPETRLGDV